MKTLVGLLWSPQTREHSHRPEPPPIYGRLHPRGEGVNARESNVPGILNVFCVFRSVESLDLQIGDSGETRQAFRVSERILDKFPFRFFLSASTFLS